MPATGSEVAAAVEENAEFRGRRRHARKKTLLQKENKKEKKEAHRECPTRRSFRLFEKEKEGWKREKVEERLLRVTSGSLRLRNCTRTLYN